ncbi:MAG: TonB-dependent receptor [Bacteroidales bacterium]|nr:TonB-dependent receptor [Bacteroidales bacterium]
MDSQGKSRIIEIVGGVLLSLALLLPSSGYSAFHMPPDTLSIENGTNAESLSEVAVVAQLKQRSDLRLEPLSGTTIKMEGIERRQIARLGDFASYAPNLYIPDYGSKITSSIYIRGLGSRMDNPAIGLYIDRVPYLNKNGFDTELWDIMRMEVLRGPQSTLYGRNTIGGIINIYTLSPMLYEGARFSASFGSGNSYSFKASTYNRLSDKVGFSLGGQFYSSDGFVDNEYNGSDCDWQMGGTGKLRVVYKPNSRLTIDNNLTAGQVNQGGYAYSLYDPETALLKPVNYNDKSGYKRTSLTYGLSFDYETPDYFFSSVTSWQYLDDCMTLDQDFTPKSMFTLQQSQHEHTLTQDFVFKSRQKRDKELSGRGWEWLNGATLFYKNMRMAAPVRFKEDGINELILQNMNNGIHSIFPDADILFEEDEFDICSNFKAPVFGAAIYHQSHFNIGRFTFTAGLRIDYEHTELDYHSYSTLHYRFTLTMPEFKEFKSDLKGVEKRNFIEPLPKFAVKYSLEERGNLYATVSRGFKAGGYNTQMFSDILQNQMKKGLMSDLGVYFDEDAMAAGYSVGEIIAYKPEYSWNYEVGGHLNWLGGRLTADAALFYIGCTNQQLTVFPSGKTTGRMMTNAGRTRSMGAEVALRAEIIDGVDLSVSYGYTDARFTKYDNGLKDYKGKFVPYVPQNTVSANLQYTLYSLGNLLDKLTLRAAYNGIGKIYWNEENSLSQGYYSLFEASVFAHKGKFSLELWGKNLTDTNYNAFYFVSVGNAFFSKGKPAQYGVTLSMEL